MKSEIMPSNGRYLKFCSRSVPSPYGVFGRARLRRRATLRPASIVLHGVPWLEEGRARHCFEAGAGTKVIS